jgi:acetyltransferase-like isoleucine patch superfamily enzyme
LRIAHIRGHGRAGWLANFYRTGNAYIFKEYALLVNFNPHLANTLRNMGYAVPFSRPVTFSASFRCERPVVIQGTVDTNLPTQVGAFTGVYLSNLRHVAIGRYCSLAGGITLGMDDHPTDWVTSSMVGYARNVHGWAELMGRPDVVPQVRFFPNRGQTKIGNDVWIGQGAFIQAGVKIDDGAIVAARSVVTKDVPDYMIVAGVPAKLIRPRFSESIVEALQKSRWWEYSIFDLPMMLLNKPQAFCKELLELASAGKISPYVPGLLTEIDMDAICQDGAGATSP